jgi:hypothetical protein
MHVSFFSASCIQNVYSLPLIFSDSPSIEFNGNPCSGSQVVARVGTKGRGRADGSILANFRF